MLPRMLSSFDTGCGIRYPEHGALHFAQSRRKYHLTGKMRRALKIRAQTASYTRGTAAHTGVDTQTLDVWLLLLPPPHTQQAAQFSNAWDNVSQQNTGVRVSYRQHHIEQKNTTAVRVPYINTAAAATAVV